MQEYFDFAVRHWDLSLAFVVITFLLVQNFMGAKLRGFHDADPQQAVQLINHEEAVVVDVREDSEFRSGHIVDSIHIPIGKLSGELGALDQYKGRAVIVGCRSGARSSGACAILRKNGFEKVYNLRGGVMAWQNAGLPLEKESKRKKK